MSIFPTKAWPCWHWDSGEQSPGTPSTPSCGVFCTLWLCGCCSYTAPCPTAELLCLCNGMLWQGNAHLELCPFLVLHGANWWSALPIPSFSAFTRPSPACWGAPSSPQLPLTAHLQMQFPVLTHHQELLPPTKGPHKPWATAGSLPSVLHPSWLQPRAVKLTWPREGLQEVQQLRAHIDSTRQNTYSCSNWLPLQQSHSASFIFQEKNIRLEQMGEDQNRLHRTATV